MPIKGKHLLHYVPHGIDPKQFKPLSSNDSSVVKLKKQLLGEKSYDFIIAFNSRNAHRKHPANLILAFKSFCNALPKEQSDKCALIMHTDKVCDAGTDLVATVHAICPEYKVVLDECQRETDEMCAFYNIANITANVSSNEGFGLSIAESIMCGVPIIATVTGGLQDQMGFTDDNGKLYDFDLQFSTNVTGRYKKHGVWAKPLWAEVQNLQGSPPTPYIMDDLVNYSQIADAIMYWYLMDPIKRKEYGMEGRRWAMNEGGINVDNMCNQFIAAMDYTLEHFVPPKPFDIFTFEGYDTSTLPNGELGFELYKVDMDKIKKELSV